MPPKGGKKTTLKKTPLNVGAEQAPKSNLKKTATVGIKPPIRGIYLNILWNVMLVVVIPFIILFALTFSIAKVGFDNQINDTLSRGLETFKYFSKEAIQQVLGITVDENTKTALANKDVAALKSFLDKQRGDRAWIDIWLALDANGKIISSLSNVPVGTAFPRPAIIQKAVKSKTALIADDAVEENQWYSTYEAWNNDWQSQGANSQEWSGESRNDPNSNTNNNANASAGAWANQNQNASVNGNSNVNASNWLANANSWSAGNANGSLSGARQNQWNENSNDNANLSNNRNNANEQWFNPNANSLTNADNQNWNAGPKQKMVNYIIIPVFAADSTHLGTIVIGSTVNNNNWTAERIGNAFKASAGVTLNDTVVATDLKTADGKTAAVGIKIPQEAVETALLNKLYEGKGTLNGAAYRLAIDPINDVTGKFIGTHFVAIPEDQAGKTWRDLSMILILAFLGSLIFAALLAYLAAKKIAKPIKALSVAAHKIGQGDFNVAIDIKGQDEIAQLGQDFSQMEKDLEKLTAEVGRYSKEAKEKNKLLDEKEKTLGKRESEIKEMQNKLTQKEKDLSDAIEEQKRLNKNAIERELKMSELKKQIEELKAKTNGNA